MKAVWTTALGLAGVMYASSASAEQVNYTYDAKGRLVKIVKINATYAQVVSEITYDKADNRKRVKTAVTPH